MKLARVIRSVRFNTLGRLFWLCSTHPLYLLPTLKASRKTVAICDAKFGRAHHKSGRENAIRHALWNVLIIHHCIRWHNTPKRALEWTKKITEWYEDFTPNEAAARAMDLHNNEVGRTFVMQHLDKKEDLLIQEILKMLPLSRKRNTLKEITTQSTILVHLEDD